MAPKIYGSYLSPPVRATLLATRALELDVEFVTINTLAGENLTPEYLSMNPLHTIPTLKDGDFATWDSHAINGYLVGRYGRDDSLYPKDLQKRAVVDQRLFFDCGVLFERFRSLARPILKDFTKVIDGEKVGLLEEELIKVAVTYFQTRIEGFGTGYGFIEPGDMKLAIYDSCQQSVNSCKSDNVPVMYRVFQF